MIIRRILRSGATLLTVAALLTGCEPNEGVSHGKQEGEGGGHSHDHGVESPSGASFKAGKGVSVTPETRKIIGLQVADVIEEKLPREVRFTAQLFQSAAGLSASGRLPAEAASLLRPAMPVRFTASTGETADGMTTRVVPPLAGGDAEVVASLPATAGLNPGSFAHGVLALPRTNAVTTIPKSALLRTAEGTFVYVVNGTAYFRTSVKLGAMHGDRIEVTDGLLPGDAVVSAAVQTLYLIELRAVKGGGHSH